jgi:ABC-type uncharacterized transport system permease subunit
MCWFEALRFRAYPLELVASLVARLAEATLYIVFWLIVSELSGATDIHPTDIVGYYLVITGLTPFLFAGFGVGAMAIDHIKSGQMSQTLVRPLNPILYPWANRVGRNSINLLFGLAQVAVGMVISGGVSQEALPYLLPVLFNAILINAAFNIIIGSCAFYFTEARGIKNAALHVASFARGEKMPIHFMPPGLAGFLLLTPFPASQYHLAIVLQGNRVPVWGDVLIGALWGVALLIGGVWLWQRGLRRYEAVGI